MSFKPWPLAPPHVPRECKPQPDIGTPLNPDGSVNYGYVQGGEWWKQPNMHESARGFVSDARFAGSGDTVIKRTDRAKTRSQRTTVDRERQYVDSKAKAAQDA